MNIRVNPLLIFLSSLGIMAKHLDRYRSGHNGPDSKSGSLARGSWVRIPPCPPNKHRDFDTKSRCSIYVPKPKNTGIFNVYFVLLIPQWSFVPLGNCLFQVPNQ